MQPFLHPYPPPRALTHGLATASLPPAGSVNRPAQSFHCGTALTGQIQRSLRASRSDSNSVSTSPSRTGPFTLRMMERLVSSMNSTRTYGTHGGRGECGPATARHQRGPSRSRFRVCAGVGPGHLERGMRLAAGRSGSGGKSKRAETGEHISRAPEAAAMGRHCSSGPAGDGSILGRATAGWQARRGCGPPGTLGQRVLGFQEAPFRSRGVPNPHLSALSLGAGPA